MSDFEKLINASDLIEWIMETDPDWCVGAVRSIVDHINKLPPAQPQRMHGRWEEKNVCDDKNVIEEWQSARCSVCGKYHTTPYMYYFDNYNFCPHCGADMREESNEQVD